MQGCLPQMCVGHMENIVMLPHSRNKYVLGAAIPFSMLHSVHNKNMGPKVYE